MAENVNPNESVDLNFLDDQTFEDVEAPSFEDIPNGRYKARVDRVILALSDTSKNLMLTWTMIITEGEYAGRYIWKRSMCHTAQCFGFLKGQLTICKIQLKPPYSKTLPAITPQLLDLLLEVKVKGNEEYGPDVTIVKYIGKAAASNMCPTTDKIPF